MVTDKENDCFSTDVIEKAENINSQSLEPTVNEITTETKTDLEQEDAITSKLIEQENMFNALSESMSNKNINTFSLVFPTLLQSDITTIRKLALALKMSKKKLKDFIEAKRFPSQEEEELAHQYCQKINNMISQKRKERSVLNYFRG